MNIAALSASMEEKLLLHPLLQGEKLHICARGWEKWEGGRVCVLEQKRAVRACQGSATSAPLPHRRAQLPVLLLSSTVPQGWRGLRGGLEGLWC